MKKLSMFACLMVLCGFMAGCSNTLEGAGQDIEHAGKKIQDTF